MRCLIKIYRLSGEPVDNVDVQLLVILQQPLPQTAGLHLIRRVKRQLHEFDLAVMKGKIYPVAVLCADNLRAGLGMQPVLPAQCLCPRKHPLPQRYRQFTASSSAVRRPSWVSSRLSPF